jgi:hypothetical protein
MELHSIMATNNNIICVVEESRPDNRTGTGTGAGKEIWSRVTEGGVDTRDEKKLTRTGNTKNVYQKKKKN